MKNGLGKETIDTCLKIYEIMLFENPDKELIYPSSKRSGFPDEGCIDHPGYFFDINDAVKALNNNACDLRETVYNAAFILCRKPGLYEPVGKEDRKYFVWNEEKQGFFEAEEPKIFAHIA